LQPTPPPPRRPTRRLAPNLSNERRNTSFLRCDRNAAAVCREPGVKVLKLGIQRACDLEVTRADILGLEVALELEHVAKLVRAREIEGAIDVRIDVVVTDLFTTRRPELPRELRAGRVVAGNGDRLSDQLVATLEDPVGD